MGLNKIVLIIGLDFKRQATFVEERGPTQMGHVGPCQLSPVFPISLLLESDFSQALTLKARVI